MTPDATWLRALPSLAGIAPGLDPLPLPRSPVDMFSQWIAAAERAGVPEPHAATFATIGTDGIPDARTLILKDFGERGWAVAGLRASRKAEQLAQRPAAALNFWWQPVVRAVRIRGTVRESPPEESAADLAGRSESARREVEPGDWVRWWIEPSRVEFWQGSPDRRHVRVVFTSAPAGWAPPVVHRE